MTPAIWRIVHDWRSKSFPLPVKRVVEIGARHADGQEHLAIRDIFPESTYIGIDLLPGVEICADATNPETWEHFAGADIVLCLETLEHVPRFWQVLRGIRENAAPGTWVVLSAPGIGFPEHRHPVDCYRFTPDGIRAALEECGAVVHSIHSVPDTIGNICHVAVGVTV